MIAVTKQGRLGNQMFQYAFAVAAAQALETDFRYDTSDLRRYFKLGPDGHRPHLPMLRRRAFLSDDLDDPAHVLDTLTDRTRYEGFFYAPGFFQTAAPDVRRYFTIRTEIETEFRRRYGDLVDQGYNCAHARLTDFATYRGDVRVAPDYYRRALAHLASPLPLVFVSDDIATARATLSDLTDTRFEANEDIVDFLLIRHARAVISSNSSFSWWAAWLNEGARVIAPRWWIGVNAGVEFPPGTIPDAWEEIPGRIPGDDQWQERG